MAPVAPTLTIIDGFEEQVTVQNATATMDPKLWDVSAGTGFSFIAGRKQGSALHIASGGVNTSLSHTVATTMLVGSVYFRIPSGASASRIFFFVADITLTVRCLAGGQIEVSWVGGTAITGPRIDDNAWHRLDLRIDTGPATHTCDWQLDGADQTQATIAGTAASNITAFRYGTNQAETITMDVDDAVWSQTSADYPIGPHTVIAVVPSADNAASVYGSAIMRQGTGVDLTSGNPGWQYLDEWPPTTGTNNADTVTEEAIGTGNFVDVEFQDLPAWVETVWGVAGTVAHQSDATSANNGTTRIVDSSAATLTDLYSGDMSETSAHYTKKIVTAPGGGWTPANVNGVRGRVGFSSDATPDPEWLALMLQVAVPDVGDRMPAQQPIALAFAPGGLDHLRPLTLQPQRSDVATAAGPAVVVGSATDRGGSRASSSATVTTTSQASSRSAPRERAATVILTSSAASSRTSARTPAQGIVVTSSAASSRSSTRAPSAATVIVIGAATSRTSARAPAAASVAVIAATSARSSSRTPVAASTTVIAAASSRSASRELAPSIIIATVPPPTSQPFLAPLRIGQGPPLLIRQVPGGEQVAGGIVTGAASSRSSGRAQVVASVVTSSAASSRSSSRAPSAATVIVIGTTSSRSASRAPAASSVTVKGAATSRTAPRVAAASLIVVKSSLTSRTAGRDLAAGAILHTVTASATSRTFGRERGAGIALVTVHVLDIATRGAGLEVGGAGSGPEAGGGGSGRDAATTGRGVEVAGRGVTGDIG